MTPWEFAVLISDVESNGHPEAFGDHGRALSSYQVHPDWLWDHAVRYRLRPVLSETWDHFIARVVVAFAAQFLPVWTPREVAMAFHEGHRVLASDLDWDEVYEVKFHAAATKRGFLPA